MIGKPGNKIRELIANFKEAPDLVIDKKKYKAELIPPSLIIARYFADEQAHVDALQVKLDEANQVLDSLVEEYSGDDGVLSSISTRPRLMLR